MMRIVEIFYSLQGEGFLAGVPSVFVRLAGCPFKCRWCDTQYAQSEEAGQQYSIDEIIQAVEKHPTMYVVLTGGEPMINQNLTVRSQLPVLVKRLKDLNKHITIETMGIAFIPEMSCDLMSISPKLSNSFPLDPNSQVNDENPKLDLAVLRCLLDEYEYQLKFVIDAEDDITEIQSLIEELGNVDRDKVMLMPQAKDRQQYLAKAPMVTQLCKQTGFAFSPRLQALLWNCEKGK